MSDSASPPRHDQKRSSSTSARRTSRSRCTSATSARRFSAMRWRGSRASSDTKSCATITSATGARSSGCCSSAGRAELNKESLAADPLGEMERIYKLVSARCKEDPATLESARAELVKLQDGDAENLALWHEMIRLSQAQFDTIYGRLGVKFDVTLGESFYNPRLKEIVAATPGTRHRIRERGRLCVFSDGSTEAGGRSVSHQGQGRLAAHARARAKGRRRGKLHDDRSRHARIPAPRVCAGRNRLCHRRAAAAPFPTTLRHLPPLASEANVRLAHVWFGSILGEDGKPFKTRSGETIKLADLLDEAEERALKNRHRKESRRCPKPSAARSRASSDSAR